MNLSPLPRAQRLLDGELTGGDGKLYGPVLGMVAGVAMGLLVSVALNAYSGFLGIALPFMRQD